MTFLFQRAGGGFEGLDASEQSFVGHLYTASVGRGSSLASLAPRRWAHTTLLVRDVVGDDLRVVEHQWLR